MVDWNFTIKSGPKLDVCVLGERKSYGLKLNSYTVKIGMKQMCC